MQCLRSNIHINDNSIELHYESDTKVYATTTKTTQAATAAAAAKEHKKFMHTQLAFASLNVCTFNN